MVKEVFSQYFEMAQKKLEGMSLEEKVGQIFLARYPKEGVSDEIKELAPGGYILFRDVLKGESEQSITKKIQDIQRSSKIPLFIATDEEGGAVCRFSAEFRSAKFLAPGEVYKKGLEELEENTIDKALFLKTFGVNLNLAPVCDISSDPTSFIFSRTLRVGPEETAKGISAMVKCYNESSMLSCLKHFPGYGENLDTHKVESSDSRLLSDLKSKDFIPFAAGIESGAPMVMISHQILDTIDQGVPASLSARMHEILRDTLKFSGIIITDSLSMGAIAGYKTSEEVAVQAVLAGNDMLLTSDLKKQKEAVVNAVRSGIIEESAINNSVKRIIAAKMSYSLMKPSI